MSDDDDGSGNNDNPDPAAFIIGVVLLAFLCLGILRFCDLCCKKVRSSSSSGQDDDVEHLDPSIEINNGCWKDSGFAALFSCCSEISENSEVESDKNVESSVVQENGEGCSVPPSSQVSSGQEEGKNNNCRKKKVVAATSTKKSIDISNINVALKYLQRQQQNESSSESNSAKLARIRLVQNLLLLDTKLNKPTEASMDAALIIGVDATPKVLGGFCVNLKEMRLEYYVIKMEDFPWPVNNLNDSVEFEMKNLQFALAVWSESIRKFGRMRLYTDNNGLCGTSEYGLNAKDLLRHFTDCEGVVLVNEEEVYVNRMEDLASFARHIQPADDLSRWQVDKAVEFLCKYYGIHSNRTKGTLKLTRHGSKDTKPWYDPSDRYQVQIDLAQVFAYKFHCEKCDIITFG